MHLCTGARCLAVTPAGYAQLSRHCAQLRELRAYACAPVDDSVLEALAALPELRLLDICGAHLVTGVHGSQQRSCDGCLVCSLLRPRLLQTSRGC